MVTGICPAPIPTRLILLCYAHKSLSMRWKAGQRLELVAITKGEYQYLTKSREVGYARKIVLSDVVIVGSFLINRRIVVTGSF